MRNFPRAPRRHAAAAIAASLTIAAMAIPFVDEATVPTASAQTTSDDLKQKRDRVEERLEHAHDELEHSSAAVRKASNKLQAAQSQLAGAQRSLTSARTKLASAQAYDEKMQGQLSAAVAKLKTAKKKLAEGREAVAEQRTEVRTTVVDLYTEGDPELLSFAQLWADEDAEDITRRASFMDTVVGSQSATYDTLRAAEVRLQVSKQKVATAEQAVRDKREAAAENLTTMQTLETDAQEAASAVQTLVGKRRTAQSAAARAKKADAAELARLEQREARIKRQILRAARAAAGGYRGDTGGILGLPSYGPITSPYGWRKHPIYGYWGLHNGTDFGAQCGSALYAVEDGTVIETYYDAVYGNRLYLSLGNYNGKNVTAVYNHLSRYQVSEGERVSRGDVIGNVGTTGWSTGCHLHFTILVNGDPVDPMRWLG